MTPWQCLADDSPVGVVGCLRSGPAAGMLVRDVADPKLETFRVVEHF
ncbi:hypothetical protein [Actinoplanes sp. TFC3]|nr:hypothetical protein [Actinoplanes sp. TFC3]